MPTETSAVAASTSLSQNSSDIALYSAAPNWLYNLHVLWQRRGLLLRITAIAFLISLTVSFIIPKTYISQARIMPPETANSSSMLFTALAGHALGSDALGGLAASLMGGRNSGALFMELLRSDSVSGRVIDRFHLQSVYHKRYRVDTAKVLARRTIIAQDKKSGVLTLAVKDRDPQRARDMVQAYLEELNTVVNRTSTSPAHQERLFVERRLQEVKADLTRAQEAMSEFSSTHSAIDLKEQARAVVEGETKVQGELIAAQSELESLRQVYGDANVRVRATEARIASLKHELTKLGGSSAPLADPSASNATATLANSAYVPLRQVPRLAVPWANLYRDVRVQETVFDLLTQQYEMARIQEAKDIPVVNVIDPPGIPEKKSFPPRAILTIAFTLLTMIVSSFAILGGHYWTLMDAADPRKRFGIEAVGAIVALPRNWKTRRSGK